MSKNHRGKGIVDQYRHGRGTCPNCNNTGIKLMYEKELNGKKSMVCKICNVTLKKKEAAAKSAE
ncbi:MAG: hypothetical protein JXR70_05025 [Spirochaetales bacterium]|nr:hypothetical protein [Spirochaetales bacterium]